MAFPKQSLKEDELSKLHKIFDHLLIIFSFHFLAPKDSFPLGLQLWDLRENKVRLKKKTLQLVLRILISLGAWNGAVIRDTPSDRDPGLGICPRHSNLQPSRILKLNSK